MRPEEHNCEDKERCCCLHFRDAWTAGSIYRPGDAVPYNGSSYVAIHWNQNDPPPSPNWATIASKGDAGPAGAPGAPGPPSPAVITGAYVAHRGSGPNDQFTNLGTGGSDIDSLTVPAGTYLVLAMTLLLNGDNDPQTWTLELNLGGTVFAQMQGSIPGTGAAGFGQGGGTIMGLCQAPAGGIITLRGYGFNTSAGALDIVALPLGNVHT